MPTRDRRSGSPTRRPGRSRWSTCRSRRRYPRARRSRARSRPARTGDGGGSSSSSKPSQRPNDGDPGRMSTSTSRIDPRAQRTSFAMPGWKCMPRSTPRAEREWLSWTHSSSTPSSASVLARKVSRKKPRASPWTVGSSRSGPFEAGFEAVHGVSASTRSQISRASASDDVAAGDGALRM